MKILLTISYNGKNYVGWQKQKNGVSVQETIENALALLLGENVDLHGSGRTDSGVHALAQTAHFESSSPKLNNFFENGSLLSNKLVSALNANLPASIKIVSAKKVAPSFHARFDVKKKTYLYRLSWNETPFNIGFVGIVKEKPNLEEMKNAAKFLIGEKDFSSFCSAKTETKDFVRTIYGIKITGKKDEITFEISGNGFLYNMVRIIVGTLFEVGIGKRSPKSIIETLEAKDRTKAGKTAPAEGLYLKEVKY